METGGAGGAGGAGFDAGTGAWNSCVNAPGVASIAGGADAAGGAGGTGFETATGAWNICVNAPGVASTDGVAGAAGLGAGISSVLSSGLGGGVESTASNKLANWSSSEKFAPAVAADGALIAFQAPAVLSGLISTVAGFALASNHSRSPGYSGSRSVTR